MGTDLKPNSHNFTGAALVLIIAFCLVAGNLLGYSISAFTSADNVGSLQNQVSALQDQISSLKTTQNTATQSNTYVLEENVSLAQLYANVKDSVVVIEGSTVSYDMFHRAYYSEVQGSGFVYNFTGQMTIITNNHVVKDSTNITVTFVNGDAYTAKVLGSDPYADLAVLSTDAPPSEYSPLEIIDSSTLNVGDALVAVGGPYGLAGTMTTGIVSALGRTITEDMSGSYPIANVIQTSTPINSGNSGGPLMTYEGQVVGITTAIVSDSQGVGFAIPSSTILREIESLVTEGAYNNHPTIGASGTDMTYDISKAINVNVTYGWLVISVADGGPAQTAKLNGGTQRAVVAGQTVTVGGDVIIAINDARIRNLDDLSTFLEEHTLPGQTIDLTVVRNEQTMSLSLTVGKRSSSTSPSSV